MEEQIRFCKNCGNSINPGDRFCLKCGQALIAGAPVASGSPIAPTAPAASEAQPPSGAQSPPPPVRIAPALRPGQRFTPVQGAVKKLRNEQIAQQAVVNGTIPLPADPAKIPAPDTIGECMSFDFSFPNPQLNPKASVFSGPADTDALPNERSFRRILGGALIGFVTTFVLSLFIF